VAERRIDMNIEQLKQFIKEVRWGFLATTDGRKSSQFSFRAVVAHEQLLLSQGQATNKE